MESQDKSGPMTPRSTVRRIPARGVYDRALIHRILDEALICHVGFVDDGQPVVIPTIHARAGDTLYLHGSRSSRMLRSLGGGAPACVTATLVDGIVVARSAFHSSMNYRSVVVLGSGREVTEHDEKWSALKAITEQVLPGRWVDARLPTEAEVAATAVVAFPLHEMSAKVRSGPPSDDEADYVLPIWAGVIPLALTAGPPEPDPGMTSDVPVPDHVAHYTRTEPTG